MRPQTAPAIFMRKNACLIPKDGKMSLAEAMQALSACDRLEEGVRNGDCDALRQANVLIRFWLDSEDPSIEAGFANAFRSMLTKCVDGDQQDISTVLLGVRCVAESRIESILGDRNAGANQGGND